MTAGEGGAPASPDAQAITVYLIPTDAIIRAETDLRFALIELSHGRRNLHAARLAIQTALAELERRVSPEGGAQPK